MSYQAFENRSLTAETTQVTVSPDGRFFTTLSRDSRVLKLWKKMKSRYHFLNCIGEKSSFIPATTNTVNHFWPSLKTVYIRWM